ncbi:MAG: putative poly(beta-D-mannuronate) O-acetylase [Myxococcales bacterium]|nr:putative poly(beta-D-mannuronate) O-acetylase [Myxococcales bacterium]
MLFSSPDYPLFLIAVFFLYALSRGLGVGGSWGRLALRVLIGVIGIRLVGASQLPVVIAFLGLYALSRRAGVAGTWGRTGIMVLLGDLVFTLVAKDPDTLWDPLGGALYRLMAAGGTHAAPSTWPIATLAARWAIGLAVLGGAITLGRRAGGWIASPRGQQIIARGIVLALAIVGGTVAIASHADVLDLVTSVLVEHGHLLVLLVLGVGIGAAIEDTYRPLGRLVILFVVSSLFYQAWASAMPGPYRYLLGLLLGTIVLDYYLAIWIENNEQPVARKVLVIVSLCSNLGILVFFKYTDFFTQEVASPIATHLDAWLGTHLAARVPDPLHLILPAGISFHTFQSLSYTIDVYRKQLRATRSVIQFATFVLFFPQLVAGPIVRAQDLLPQLAELPALEIQKATDGLFRILVGLFKKIALADTLAISIVERVFDNPERFSGLEVLVGVYAYALQIYLDFSAYSDIAIGSAQLLGFTLPENFRTPYRSANLQEFWRRWHISLSTWLRDYLYVTLGGNRGAAWRTYLNLILTMILGGLWHGASWAFIVWGALHGFGLAVTRFFQRATAAGTRSARAMVVWCAAFAVSGLAIHLVVVPNLVEHVALLSPETQSVLAWVPGLGGTWSQLVFAWLYLTPLWAVSTAWLGADRPVVPPPEVPRFLVAMRSPGTRLVECLRLAMCFAAVGFLVALPLAESWTWLPMATAVYLLGLAADLVERGAAADVVFVLRRGLAIFLVFNYVCLAWIFFRASSFDSALAMLRQIAGGELDHANLVPMVTTALGVGMLCHFFAANSFRWLRDRFMQMPAWGQGSVLAAGALVLRELAHPKIVPFIYFQF